MHYIGTERESEKMKRNLANRLGRFNLVLVGTRFGIHGDWMVEDENGIVVGVFTTLGRVRQFVESLESGVVA